MGFMDKAKQLAEQAQQKLDEAQAQFNKTSPESQPDPSAPEGTVRYDEHGRPIQESPPAEAAATPDPAAPTSDPAAPTPVPAAPTPTSPSAPAAPTAEGEPEPPPRRPSGDADATPDPFKPLQQ